MFFFFFLDRVELREGKQIGFSFRSCSFSLFRWSFRSPFLRQSKLLTVFSP